MKKKKKQKPRVEFIHTGSHLLNLAASGKAKKGGWARGRITNLVGDGSSGKTLLALEACAHMSHHPKNKNVSIVYDNVEGVMDFPIEQMYGRSFVKGTEWRRSSTVEEFGKVYQNKVKDLKEGEGLLYVLDSLDALPSRKAVERMEEELRSKDDSKQKGSYGMDKQKYLSASFFNTLCSTMQGKDATLIIISQVRDNIGAGLFEEKSYRAGGKALDFYTHMVCWLGVIKKVPKTHKGQKITIGVSVRARFKRNKVAKPFREAVFDILFDYGVDDLGSMLDYYWKGKPELKKRKALIKQYEEDEALENDLIDLVQNEWDETEEAVKPDRKKRFE